MWRALAGFEIRYQLRQPVVYLVTAALVVLLFVGGAGHGPGSAPGALDLTAPAVILQQLVESTYLLLFLMTALVASAAVRDDDRNTAALFLSKPIARFDYLSARYAGAMLVCVLASLVGAAALAAGHLMPGLEPTRLGPFRVAPFAFALAVLVIPTVLALGAATYAVATWTRSTLATCLGTAAFVALSAVASSTAPGTDVPWLAQVLDPLGVMPLAAALRYWTAAELNSGLPGVTGTLLLNRIVWLGLGAAALALAVLRFDPAPSWRIRRTPVAAAAVPPPPTSAASMPVPARRTVSARRNVLHQFLRQLRLEATAVLTGLPFLAMLVLGLVALLDAAGSAGHIFGMPVHPRTHLMVEALRGGYSIILLLVVVIYSGELVWRERALGLDEVHDAMPTPVGLQVGAKLCALLLVVAAFLFAGVLALAAFQLAKGHAGLEPGVYAVGAASAAVYPALMAVLALACHVLAPNRFVGYGLVIAFIVGWDLLEEFGFEHHAYRYASLPPLPYSDFSGYQPFLTPFVWFGLYWSFVALVLAGLATLFWPRGTDRGRRARWAAARARFTGSARGLIVAGATGAVATGAWIVHNTHVLNDYVPSTRAADRRADYERRYRPYMHLEQPRIVAVRAEVDLVPERGTLSIRGSYRVRNRSTAPIGELHVSLPEQARATRLVLPPHAVVLRDAALGYGIYRLQAPIEPGAEISVGFEVDAGSTGFVNQGTPTAVLANGSYFTRRDYFPVLGYDAQRQLVDPDERRRRGLAPELRLPGVDDPGARRNTPRASDADRIEFDTTISTAIDQVAVTSGRLQREWTRDGRRHFRYRSDQPITHHFAFASAKYAVARSDWDGVAIEVYHHPDHGANVGRMIDAARASLAYYTANFGPYQHDHLRIVEFPGHVRDATAFPGLIAFSEAMGFNARLDGTKAIDFPFYVTAHEVAHQWWGQQLVGANVPGVAMLHETLAQHSALLVVAAELGPARLRDVLAHERSWYLRGRAGARGVEPPLTQVERQEHVYYHKGALAMHALREAVGEATLNQVLKRYLARVALQDPPYTTVAELMDELRAAVPPESTALVADLFEQVTLHDVRVVAAQATARDDGRFAVRIDLAARKLQSDGGHTEREVGLDGWIDIAVVTEGDAAGSDGAPVLERRHLQRSPASFEIVVDRPPLRIEVDPHFKLIERDRGDNVFEIAPAGKAPMR